MPAKYGGGKPPGVRCHAKKRDGEQCGNWASPGLKVCRYHGAGTKRAIARSAVIAEVMHWGLGDTAADPGEVLLRLVTQSAVRAERYAAMLEEAYDAAERLRAAHEAGHLLLAEDTSEEGEPAALQQARADLDRVFTTGGVAALVGQTYADTKNGDLYATGEAIRGLAQLEAAERDRCANFAAKAIAAGLAERHVRLAEQQGALIAEVLRAVLDDPELGLTPEQRRAMPHVARRHLAVVS